MRPVEIRRRERVEADGWPTDLHPLLARVYAARGLAPGDVAHARLADLAAPDALVAISVAA